MRRPKQRMAAANAGQIDHVQPGPIDQSVLTLQANHRSEAIWNGRDPGSLKCRTRSEEFSNRVPMVDDRVVDIIKALGLEGLLRTPVEHGPLVGAYGPLVRGPLSLKWLWVLNKKNRLAHVFLDRYREQIALMLPGQVVWQPYEAELEDLPLWCVAGRAMWTATVPLVCFHLVEKHTPNRVVRQFGMIQEIPYDVDTDTVLHAIDLRGKVGVDWMRKHAGHIREWGNRLQQCCEAVLGDMPPQHEYFDWFKRVTRRFIDIPGARLILMIEGYVRLLGRHPVGTEDHNDIIDVLKAVQEIGRIQSPIPEASNEEADTPVAVAIQSLSTTERPSTSKTPARRGSHPPVATPRVVPTPDLSLSTPHPSPSPTIPSPTTHPSPSPTISPPTPHPSPSPTIPPPTPRSFPKLSDPTPPDSQQQEPPSHDTPIGPSSGIDPPHVQTKQAVGLPVVVEGRPKHISKAPPYGRGGHKHGHKVGPEAFDERHARPPHYTRQRKVQKSRYFPRRNSTYRCGAFGSNRGLRPVPPEKGIFTLDHMHLWDLEKKEYLSCLKSSGHTSEKCRHLSKKYLQCRMEKNLMAKQDMSELGFGKESNMEASGQEKGNHGTRKLLLSTKETCISSCQYIKMRTQRISLLLKKRFTTPNWIKHKEPREVHIFVDLFLQEDVK
ncbi:hypothetical protein CMV_008721 [Castanea mollissima]|uniref:Uncharacterized protein n=1 Tax=Castanea mollissima TaxID=60419 RepID=A0A8J4VRK8_9ROSI|nr:hypothetical protein CMV_008721 [Castanea mollissima]